MVGLNFKAVSGYEADRSPALGAQLPVVLRGGARESHTCTLSLLQGGVTESVTLELMALLIRPGETGLMLSQTPQREAWLVSIEEWLWIVFPFKDPLLSLIGQCTERYFEILVGLSFPTCSESSSIRTDLGVELRNAVLGSVLWWPCRAHSRLQVTVAGSNVLAPVVHCEIWEKPC